MALLLLLALLLLALLLLLLLARVAGKVSASLLGTDDLLAPSVELRRSSLLSALPLLVLVLELLVLAAAAAATTTPVLVLLEFALGLLWFSSSLLGSIKLDTKVAASSSTAVSSPPS